MRTGEISGEAHVAGRPQVDGTWADEARADGTRAEDAPRHLQDILRPADLAHVVHHARIEGVDATHWAVANGVVDEEVAFRALARRLGLTFVADPPSSPLPDMLPDRVTFERMARMRGMAGGRAIVAPPDDGIAAWHARLAREPELRDRIAVTTPSAARARLTEDLAPLLTREAVDGLSSRRPDLSARTLNGRGAWWATLALGWLSLVLLVPAVLWPGDFSRAVNVLASLVFCVFVAARLAIALEADPKRRAHEMRRAPPPLGRDVPFYSVLVALYHEGNQVRDLVAALDALDWPRARREIVLVCEADDAQTLDALAGIDLPPDMRVVAVPASLPRTKPKALDFALPTCRGDLVVLYDAEDRPDPLQLREAWAAFEEWDATRAAKGGATDEIGTDENATGGARGGSAKGGGARLACLQAPLHIANSEAGLLPKLFAAEYSALFDSFLPALSERGGPVPLGGTSNHFRREALDECGAWDGWNVTEDADLGVRFARAGWAISTIARATREEAPAFLRPWIRQRTRWFKGWMQTWLVHMREPARFRREIGPRAFVTFHVFITGMLVSALVHPLFLGSALVNGVWSGFHGWAGPETAWHRALLAFDLSVIAFGYLAFAIAAWRTMGLRGLAHLRPWLLLVPLYWAAMSWAAWRALWQLHRDPSGWEKTPHGLS